ncbi:MAG: hypothetical protein R3A13_06170 [Bdellovibrionota bacterium]
MGSSPGRGSRKTDWNQINVQPLSQRWASYLSVNRSEFELIQAIIKEDPLGISFEELSQVLTSNHSQQESLEIVQLAYALALGDFRQSEDATEIQALRGSPLARKEEFRMVFALERSIFEPLQIQISQNANLTSSADLWPMLSQKYTTVLKDTVNKVIYGLVLDDKQHGRSLVSKEVLDEAEDIAETPTKKLRTKNSHLLSPAGLKLLKIRVKAIGPYGNLPELFQSLRDRYLCYKNLPVRKMNESFSHISHELINDAFLEIRALKALIETKRGSSSTEIIQAARKELAALSSGQANLEDLGKKLLAQGERLEKTSPERGVDGESLAIENQKLKERIQTLEEQDRQQKLKIAELERELKELRPLQQMIQGFEKQIQEFNQKIQKLADKSDKAINELAHKTKANQDKQDLIETLRGRLDIKTRRLKEELRKEYLDKLVDSLDIFLKNEAFYRRGISSLRKAKRLEMLSTIMDAINNLKMTLEKSDPEFEKKDSQQLPKVKQENKTGKGMRKQAKGKKKF